MKRPVKRKWIAFAAGACVAAFLFLWGCASFGPPKAEKVFAGREMPAVRTYDLPGGRRLATAETGDRAGPLVLFVHGTPGQWSDFAYVMKNERLTSRAWLVAVDRPGWGGSAGGGLVTSMEDQARALRTVLEAHPENVPAIVVGHSLGGPVAARLAMDAPDLVGALVLVAGSIDPAQEKTAWYQAVGRWPVVRWAVPRMLVAADEEIIPLKGELEQMLPWWKTLRMPVTVIQGEKDGLVPPANADFAERMITEAPLDVRRIPRQGHLIPWERPDLIVDAVLDAIGSAARGKISASSPSE